MYKQCMYMYMLYANIACKQRYQLLHTALWQFFSKANAYIYINTQEVQADQTLPIASKESLTWIILKRPATLFGLGLPGNIFTVNTYTFRWTNIAMENGPFEDVFPTEKWDFPWLC